MSGQLDKLKSDTLRSLIKIGNYVVNHRTILVFLIASAAVLIALLQTSQYIDPSRDEDAYQEGLSSINYKTIDQEVVEKLQKTQEDQAIDANSNFVPNRNNPFTE